MGRLKLDDLFDHLRSLGFGASLVAGLFGIFYLFAPKYFPAGVDLRTVLLVGAVLGSGLHRVIDKLILGPLRPFLDYYSKLGQLILLRSLVGRKLQKECIEKLTRKFFLGEPTSQPTPTPPEQMPALPPAKATTTSLNPPERIISFEDK
jgi:hypothetical protein